MGVTKLTKATIFHANLLLEEWGTQDSVFWKKMGRAHFHNTTPNQGINLQRYNHKLSTQPLNSLATFRECENGADVDSDEAIPYGLPI